MSKIDTLRAGNNLLRSFLIYNYSGGLYQRIADQVGRFGSGSMFITTIKCQTKEWNSVLIINSL